MLDALGRFFFRWRNILFPVVIAILLAALPPRGFRDRAWNIVAVAGLLALLAGQTLRVITIGLDYVKRGGKKKNIYADHLVTGGVYAHCRNPMYVGNLLVTFGLLAFIGQPWSMLIGGTFFLLVYLSIVRGEECYLQQRFGREYDEYCRRSPRWMVRITGLLATLRRYRFDWPAVIVKEYGTIFTTLLLVTAVAAWKTWRTGPAAFQRLLPVYVAVSALLATFYIVARWLKKGRDMRPRGPRLVDPDSPHDADATPTAGLGEHRERIDEIDAAILDLLNQRAAQVLAIYEHKRATGIERFDPQRTQNILQRLIRLNTGPLSDEDVRRMYTDLLWHFAHEFNDRADDTAVPVVEVVSTAAIEAPR